MKPEIDRLTSVDFPEAVGNLIEENILTEDEKELLWDFLSSSYVRMANGSYVPNPYKNIESFTSDITMIRLGDIFNTSFPCDILYVYW